MANLDRLWLAIDRCHLYKVPKRHSSWRADDVPTDGLIAKDETANTDTYAATCHEKHKKKPDHCADPSEPPRGRDVGEMIDRQPGEEQQNQQDSEGNRWRLELYDVEPGNSRFRSRATHDHHSDEDIHFAPPSTSAQSSQSS